jgi:hypothetical protein
MKFLKTNIGKAILGVLVAIGILAGTLLDCSEILIVDDIVVAESQTIGE